jgi:hypothetical protein
MIANYFKKYKYAKNEPAEPLDREPEYSNMRR